MVVTPFVMQAISSTGMDIGRNSLSPITEDNLRPFIFKGRITKLKIRLLDRSNSREEAITWFRTEMNRQ